MAGFFEKLGKKLFGQKSTSSRTRSVEHGTPQARQKEVRRPSPPKQRSVRQREPYFVQIGFDFGTAFSKCVCRDIMLDKAWVYTPNGGIGNQMPFLMHNAVSFDGLCFGYQVNPSGAYTQNALMHIKMALQKIGLDDLNNGVLMPFKRVLPKLDSVDLPEFVELCAVYLLAGMFGDIKADISARYPGQCDDDYIAINMAVPVADANDEGVNKVFERVLRIAWVLADELAGHPEQSLMELASAVERNREKSDSEEVRNACCIYPEVSANVQGFVRSRNSQTGLYLFSDTGAGTVDQSIFLFSRPDGRDQLTYLYAEVLPLGSSHIEYEAARRQGDLAWGNLERLRELKEQGHMSNGLAAARNSIQYDLNKATVRSIAYSKEKLVNRNQMNRITVIFGGGGHCKNPYESGVMQMYEHPLFRKEDIENRKRNRDRFDIGMPTPRDLQLQSSQARWMNRLSVAYGLSFEQGQLAAFKLPHEVENPTPEEVWRPTTRHRQMTSKDDV